MEAVYEQSTKAAREFPYAANIGIIFAESSEAGTAILLTPDLAITCGHLAMLRTKGQRQLFVAAHKCLPPIAALPWDEAVKRLQPGTFSTYTVHTFANMEEEIPQAGTSAEEIFALLHAQIAQFSDPKKLLTNPSMTVGGKHFVCKDHDIALLKLHKPLQLEIARIPLYCPKQDEPPCKAVLIGGFGIQVDAKGTKHARTVVVTHPQKRSQRTRAIEATLGLVEQNLTWCPSAHRWFSKWKILGDEPSNFLEESEGFTGRVYSGQMQEGQSGGPVFLKKGENWVLGGFVSQDIHGGGVKHVCAEVFRQFGKYSEIMQQIEFFQRTEVPLFNVFSAPTKKIIKKARNLAANHEHIIEKKA